MSNIITWLFVVLLIYNITTRFGNTSDIMALTNLLTIIVCIVWSYLIFKNHKKELKE